MVAVNEQAVAFGKSQVEAALRFTQITAASLEKLAEVQFNAAKTAFAEIVQSARSVSSIKDPGQLASLGSSLAQPAWDKAQAYAKSVYEVAASTQAGVSALLEQQVGEFNKNVVVALDGLVKNAPAGSESVVAMVKSAVQSATSAYDSLLKASKQFTTLAESNIASLTPAVAPARRK